MGMGGVRRVTYSYPPPKEKMGLWYYLSYSKGELYAYCRERVRYTKECYS